MGGEPRWPSVGSASATSPPHPVPPPRGGRGRSFSSSEQELNHPALEMSASPPPGWLHGKTIVSSHGKPCWGCSGHVTSSLRSLFCGQLAALPPVTRHGNASARPGCCWADCNHLLRLRKAKKADYLLRPKLGVTRSPLATCRWSQDDPASAPLRSDRRYDLTVPTATKRTETPLPHVRLVHCHADLRVGRRRLCLGARRISKRQRPEGHL